MSRTAIYVILSLAIMLTLILNGCQQNSLPALPESVTKKQHERLTYTFDHIGPAGAVSAQGITIMFDKTADWDAGSGQRGFTANISIINNSAEDINAWELHFSLLASISTIWNASYSEQEQGFIVTPANWNKNIKQGQSRSFGFNGRYSGVFQEPTAYILSGIPIGDQAPPESIDVNCQLSTAFSINSDWNAGNGKRGFVAEMQLTNIGSHAVNWTLTFDLEAHIENMWNASHSANPPHYQITPASWNTRIEVGESVSFGFQGTYNSDSLAEPSNISCNGSPLSLPASSDLAPLWQRTDLIYTSQDSYSSSSSYNADSQSFTLANLQTNTTGGQSGNHHYVYQELSSHNSTLSARVQRQKTHQTATAGLMIRASNNPSAAYIHATLNDDTLQIISKGGTNQQAHVVATQPAQSPIWIRLSREGENVHVYESDDGMNYSLITTLTLIFTDPFTMGLTTTTQQGLAQADFDNVVVQSPIEATFTATPTTGTVPLTVHFDASGTSGGTGLEYSWDFGDGTMGEGIKVSHTYQYAGTYFPILTVKHMDTLTTSSSTIDVLASDANEIVPANLRTATSPEGRWQHKEWWLRHNLSQMGVSRLLDWFTTEEVAGVRAFTPDKKWVIYERRDFEKDYGRPGISSTKEFFLVNLDTGQRTTIDKPIQQILALSQDGTLLAYRANNTHDITIARVSDPEPVMEINFLGEYIHNDSSKPLLSIGGHSFSPSNSKLGFFLQYDSSVLQGHGLREIYNLKRGLVFLEIDITLNTQQASIDIEEIEQQAGFILDAGLQDNQTFETFGGTYWEGESLKWFFEPIPGTPSGALVPYQASQPPVPSLNNAGAGFLSFPFEKSINLSVTGGYGASPTHINSAHYSIDFDSANVEGEGLPITAAVSGELYFGTRYPYTSHFESFGKCNVNLYSFSTLSDLITNFCPRIENSTTSSVANQVWIKAEGDNNIEYFVRHAHLLYQSTPSSLRESNAQVEQGQVIGLMSETGIVTAVHLHFQVNKRTINNNAQLNPLTSVLPEPIDGENNIQLTSYTSQNTLEDLQMAAPFSLRQFQADGSLMSMSGSQHDYDNEFEFSDPDVTDDNADYVLTLNSEGDVHISTEVIYPGSALFADHAPSLQLRFRDDRKAGASNQERKSKRYLPLESLMLSSSAAGSSLSLPNLAIAAGASAPLDFILSHEDTQQLYWNSSAQNHMFDMWLERDVGGGESVPVWNANYPVVKSAAGADTAVYRNPIRVKVIDLEPTVGGMVLSHTSDAAGGLEIDSGSCNVLASARGVGIAALEVALLQQGVVVQQETVDNPLGSDVTALGADIHKRLVEATFDVPFLADGAYSLRLIATMSDGQLVTEERSFHVSDGACGDGLGIFVNNQRLDDATVPIIRIGNGSPSCPIPAEVTIEARLLSHSLAEHINITGAVSASARDASFVQTQTMLGAGIYHLSATAELSEASLSTSGSFSLVRARDEPGCEDIDEPNPEGGLTIYGGGNPLPHSIRFCPNEEITIGFSAVYEGELIPDSLTLENLTSGDRLTVHGQPRVDLTPISFLAEQWLTATATLGGETVGISGKYTILGFEDDSCDPGDERDKLPECEDCDAAGHYGDPHVITFDGLGYSFQGAGEYVLAQSDDDFINVQVRQLGDPGGRIAFDKAVAANVAGDIVGLYYGETIPLWINGVATPMADGEVLALPQGGQVRFQRSAGLHFADIYDIYWPASAPHQSAHLELSLLSSHINIYNFWLPSVYKNRMRGQLGNYNDLPEDDLRLVDGTVLLAPVSFEDLYGRFSESWRIQPEESLFIYSAGQDSRSFTDYSFPDRPLSLERLPEQQRQYASERCMLLNIIDPFRLESCILDLAVTQDDRFATAVLPAPPSEQQLDIIEPIFEDRTLLFQGQVVDFEELKGLATVDVRIEAPGAFLRDGCQTHSGTDGSFSCRVTLVDEQPFSLNVYALGYGDESVQQVTLNTADIPLLGQTQNIELPTLKLHPTRLKLSGVMVDRHGQPLEHAEVYLEGAGWQASTTTDAQGSYSLIVGLPSNALAGQFELRARASTPLASAQERLTLSYSAAPKTIVTLQQDLSLDLDSQAAFSMIQPFGRVIDSLLEVPLDALLLDIYIRENTQELELLCHTTISALGSYRCFVGESALAIPYHDALQLDYHIYSQDGMLAFPAVTTGWQIPRSTDVNDVIPLEHELTLSSFERFLTLSGQVVNEIEHGAPVADADISLSYQGQPFCQVRTDATGTYSCPMLRQFSHHPLVLDYRVEGSWGLELGSLSLTSDLLPSDSTATVQSLDIPLRLNKITIEGVISTLGGGSVAGVQVTLSGALNQQVFSDAQGHYLFSALYTPQTMPATLSLDLSAQLANQVTERQLSYNLEAGLNHFSENLELRSTAPGSLRWTHLLEPSLGRALAYHEGKLYLLTSSTQTEQSILRAYDMQGQVVWEQSLNSYARHSDTVHIAVQDNIYVALDNMFIAYSLSGEHLWQTDVTNQGNQRILSLAVSDREQIYLGLSLASDTGQVIALASDGTESWRVDTTAGVHSIAIASNGTVYVQADQSFVFNPYGSLQHTLPVNQTLVLDHDTVYGIRTNAEHTTLIAFDLSGETLWTYALADAEVTAMVLDEQEQLLIARAGSGELLLLQADSGAYVRSLNINDDGIDALVLADQHRLFALSKDALYAFEELGEIWHIDLPAQQGVSLALVDGLLIILNENIQALNVSSQNLRNSPWPVRGANNAKTFSLEYDAQARRLVRWQGRLVNAYADDIAMPLVSLRFEDATGQILCSTLSDTAGYYQCDAYTTAIASFTALPNLSTYRLINQQPSHVPAAQADTITTVNHDLAVTATTIQFVGQVTDASGTPLANTSVQITLEVLSDEIPATETIETSTDSQGRYMLVTSMPHSDAVSNQAITYSIASSTLVERTININADAGLLTTIEENFVLDIAEPGTIRWAYNSHLGIIHDIVLGANGHLYVIGSEADVPLGRLLALDATGQHIWSSSLEGGTPTAFVSNNNRLYLAQQQHLLSLNSDGSERWRFDNNERIDRIAIDAHGDLYLASSEHLTGLSQDGEILWRYRGQSDGTPAAVAITANAILYYVSGGSLHALSTQGQEIWTQPGSYKLLGLGAQDTVFVSYADYYYSDVMQFDANGQSILRFFPDYPALEGISVQHDGDFYLAAGYEGAALTRYSSTGEQLWRYDNFDYAISSNSVPVLSAEGDLYFFDDRNHLIALAQNGQLQWSQALASATLPLLTDNGDLYVASYGGIIYALHTGTTGLMASPWPAKLGDNQHRSRGR